MIHECKEDGVMPEEFFQAIRDGKQIQVKSSIGWIDIDSDEVEFRNSVEYRIKP